MFNIKSNLLDKIIQPNIRDSSTMVTIAKVTASNEINNTCNIIYIDKNGIKRNKDNVIVRIYDNSSGYFPAVGDFVELQLEKEICVIIARHIANYNADVRPKMQLKQDIYSDSPGCSPGGSIY